MRGAAALLMVPPFYGGANKGVCARGGAEDLLDAQVQSLQFAF